MEFSKKKRAILVTKMCIECVNVYVTMDLSVCKNTYFEATAASRQLKCSVVKAHQLHQTWQYIGLGLMRADTGRLCPFVRARGAQYFSFDSSRCWNAKPVRLLFNHRREARARMMMRIAAGIHTRAPPRSRARAHVMYNIYVCVQS